MCNNHTQGPPADETIVATSEWDATIMDDEIKGQSIEEKTTTHTHTDEFYALLSENKDRDLYWE